MLSAARPPKDTCRVPDLQQPHEPPGPEDLPTAGVITPPQRNDERETKNAMTGNKAPIRRRTISGPATGSRVYRTRSAGLPLEQVPADSQVQNLLLNFTALPDGFRSGLGDRAVSNGNASAFSPCPDAHELENLIMRVSQLLKAFRPETDTVGHLDEIIHAAFLHAMAVD